MDCSTSDAEGDTEVHRCPAWRGGTAVGAVVYLSASCELCEIRSRATRRIEDAKARSRPSSYDIDSDLLFPGTFNNSSSIRSDRLSDIVAVVE